MTMNKRIWGICLLFNIFFQSVFFHSFFFPFSLQKFLLVVVVLFCFSVLVFNEVSENSFNFFLFQTCNFYSAETF